MRPCVFALLLTTACASRPPPTTAHAPAPTADARAAWTRLSAALPGTWILQDDGGDPLEVGYRVVSHGTALLETFGGDPANQTLTVYHPDGDSMLLTHYCAQGNQVRLRASAVAPDRVAFTYLDATNVDPKQSVLHELVFVLGPDTLERTEVYQEHGGRRHTSVLRFARR